MFSPSSHNFGTCEFDSYHTVTFSYSGTEDLKPHMFVPSCGCSTPVYDNANKRLIVTLHMNARPSKNVYITCNIPEGQELIRLDAIVN